MNRTVSEPWAKRPAAAPESPAGTPATPRPSVLDAMTEFANLAGLLRMGGAVTMVAAMSAFLLQGWASVNDVSRFYMLLSQTLLLAAGGFGLSYLVKENKGARVFFGLSLLSVTANMVTLGALIFSIVQLGGGLGHHYPSFALWKATDPAAALLAGGAGILVSAPIALFSFMVLARRSARELALLFLFTHLLLLVPVRESLLVGMVAMLGVIVPLWRVHGLLAEDSALRTREGMFAIATLFVPAAIIVTRSLWLYQADAFLQAMLAGTGFAMLRIAERATAEDSTLRLPMGLASFALAAWVASALAQLFTAPHGWPVATPLGYFASTGIMLLAYGIYGVSFLLLGLDVTLRNPWQRGLFASITAVVFAISQTVPFLEVDGLLSNLLYMAAGVTMFAMGRRFQRWMLPLGATMTLAGFGCQLYRIAVFVDFTSWMTLAVLGTSAIVGASLLERHGAVIKLKYAQLAGRAEAERK